jgi:hypothetical protein
MPEPLATELEKALQAGQKSPNIPDLAALGKARARYTASQVAGALLCGAALAAWLVIWFGGAARRWFRLALPAAMVAELLWFAHGRNPQCDPALYYPRLPVLEKLAVSPPGRILGVLCLPANLGMSHALRDVRGYDSIDPRPLVELLDPVRDARFSSPTYARLQSYVPRPADPIAGEIRLPPLLNLLNVRYLIFRRAPPPSLKPFLAEQDYWVVENPEALPRAFVPSRVETAPASDRLLAILGSPSFEPRRVAYVEGSVDLPDDCRGTATIVAEIPCRVELAVDMKTPGLVVLSDLWYEGWHAYSDGKALSILRTNHAVRGVVLPEGKSTVVFRYEPASFALGMRVLGLGMIGLLAWLVAGSWFEVGSGKEPPGVR